MFDFSLFVDKLKVALQKPLPGEKAQFIMAPPERLTFDEALLPELKPRESSVLLLFFLDENKIKITFIQRPDNTGVHSGQIAFPGGAKELQDKTFKHTALRETHEEIGVNAAKINILGKLSKLYIPPSNFIVYPYVGTCYHKPKIIPNPYEVTQVYFISLDEFLNRKNVSTFKRFSYKFKKNENCPKFQIGKYLIWGATAMIMSEFLEIMNDNNINLYCENINK